MKPLALAVLTTILLAAPSRAEDNAAAPNEIIIGGETPAPVARRRTCVEVEIGGDKAFGCLNQKLRQQVDQVNPIVNVPPIDARSPDIKVGVVNMPAIRQQYGRNFGISVIPYREPVVYRAPLGLRR